MLAELERLAAAKQSALDGVAGGGCGPPGRERLLRATPPPGEDPPGDHPHALGVGAERNPNRLGELTPHALGEPKPEPDEVELTCPPLAPEVLAELERLTREKEAAVERQAFDEAASLRDAEHYLRSAAVRLVSAWRRHTVEPT